MFFNQQLPSDSLTFLFLCHHPSPHFKLSTLTKTGASGMPVLLRAVHPSPHRVQPLRRNLIVRSLSGPGSGDDGPESIQGDVQPRPFKLSLLLLTFHSPAVLLPRMPLLQPQPPLVLLAALQRRLACDAAGVSRRTAVSTRRSWTGHITGPHAGAAHGDRVCVPPPGSPLPSMSTRWRRSSPRSQRLSQ